MAIAALIGVVLFVALPGGSDDPVARSAGASSVDERDTSAGDDPGQADPEEDGTTEDRVQGILDPFRPDSVAVDASSVWVTDAACGVVVRVDKATEEVLGAVSVGESASGVGVAAGSVWVGTRSGGVVNRIDPARMVVAGSVTLPGSALGVTARGNDVWATDPIFGTVYRIDAASGSLAETIPVGSDPHHVAIGDQGVWVTNQGDDTVSVIDGRGEPWIAPTGLSPLHVEIGLGSAWVTDSADGAVRRLDLSTGDTQAVIPVGVWPHALAVAGGAVWVGTETGSFWRVDPGSNRATQVEGAEFTTIDTVVDGNDIWIADASGGTLVRFDAAAGEVASVVDLNENGDCNTFLEEALEPPTDRSL